jgi:hypothetical protein
MSSSHPTRLEGEEETLPNLPDDVRDGLDVLADEIAADPRAVHRFFPAAVRLVGARRSGGGSAGATGAEIADTVRVGLLDALASARADQPEKLAADVEDLYRHGDADEKRAVLRALPRLGLGDAALPLVRDALRTNDTRLVTAAMGAYATAYLDDPDWRQGVLKCLFVGVPLAQVHGLGHRVDHELASMVAAYADERLAAGREVPEDAARLLAGFPAVTEAAGLAGRLPGPQ